MSNRPTIAWGALALEMVSIIVAIGLGFAVTEWREDREQSARAADAVASIARELEVNRSELALAAPYYRELAQSLDSLIRVDGDAVLNERPVPGWRGLSPPTLRRASYSAAASAGALEHVAFEVANLLAEAYEAQGSVSLAVDQAMGAAIEGRLTQHSDWLRLIALLSEISLGAEITLGQTLEALGVEVGQTVR